ncbi:MAG TPA: aminopeptidase P family protein [Acidimicrobiales bacterium]|jgi:Xaa-Pro aminopeptidase|nr:aminopeptidase P family protein [Acidimicrobiales bacterium]
MTDLTPMDVAGRADRLRGAMAAADVPALLVTNLTNIRYLTGFTGSAALLLVTADELLFVTDGRYGQQSAAQLGAAGVQARIEVHNLKQKDIVASGLQRSGATRLGLEADAVTWAAQRTYDQTWFPAAELVATTGLVGGLRLLKDDGEIDRLAAAAAIADAALAEVRPRLADGPTEIEFGLDLDTAMRRLGADDVSFETIVASGPNGALPHHRPGHRTIAEGDLVVIDFGALVDGYHSDMTRTVAVGDLSETQQRMYDVVLESQAAGVAAVTDGIEAKAVDAACRSVIDGAGWGEAFLHGTGHGVGLDIHEDPRVGQSSTATLTDRCVVTVEPGVYLPEHGGVRIEDTVVVTPDGCRPITLTPKLAAV